MPKWIEEARKMRQLGHTFKDIGEAFGVTRQWAFVVCKGVKCPVDNRTVSSSRTMKALWQDPVFRQKRIDAIRKGVKLRGSIERQKATKNG